MVGAIFYRLGNPNVNRNKGSNETDVSVMLLFKMAANLHTTTSLTPPNIFFVLLFSNQLISVQYLV